MVCGICGCPHENHNCISVQDDQFSAAQVNYVGNQPRPPYNDPHSNTYNPGWRNHPNFSWGGNQGQQKQYNNQGPQNSQRQPSFPSPQLPPKQPKMEEILEVQVEVPTEKPEIIVEIKNQEAIHHPPQSSKKHTRSSSKFLEVLACLEVNIPLLKHL
ncbi:hypothetical protein PIB30_084946 [Stylosanthes scabra]|uniref:Uncharacterized protein n=1 Tax=Stylosanthes scabra TaxID=79078 RepID=A0ABU6XUJ3_9FABA|nr:hypothetical protein [Stylosanthes scabra]